MTRKFLQASLAMWRRRLAFAQRRHHAARLRHDRLTMAKWDHTITVAILNIRKRKTELAALPAPNAFVVIDGYPVVAWIAAEVLWARAHGWRGTVNSGYRTPAQQLAAATAYCRSIGKTIAQVYPNGVYASHHCQKGAYPAGAVDVSDAPGLDQTLRGLKNRKLTWGGPTIGDQVHFSADGH